MLQEQVRGRLHDLAAEGRQYDLNNKLKEWWKLDFNSFRIEVKKVFQREIPLAERDEWEAYLIAKQKEVEELTSALQSIEDELNQEVYKLFNLTPDEIKLIEENV